VVVASGVGATECLSSFENETIAGRRSKHRQLIQSGKMHLRNLTLMMAILCHYLDYELCHLWAI
jgi:hypothetical protein